MVASTMLASAPSDSSSDVMTSGPASATSALECVTVASMEGGMQSMFVLQTTSTRSQSQIYSEIKNTIVGSVK